MAPTRPCGVAVAWRDRGAAGFDIAGSEAYDERYRLIMDVIKPWYAEHAG